MAISSVLKISVYHNKVYCQDQKFENCIFGHGSHLLESDALWKIL